MDDFDYGALSLLFWVFMALAVVGAFCVVSWLFF